MVHTGIRKPVTKFPTFISTKMNIIVNISAFSLHKSISKAIPKLMLGNVLD